MPRMVDRKPMQHVVASAFRVVIRYMNLKMDWRLKWILKLLII